MGSAGLSPFWNTLGGVRQLVGNWRSGRLPALGGAGHRTLFLCFAATGDIRCELGRHNTVL